MGRRRLCRRRGLGFWVVAKRRVSEGHRRENLMQHAMVSNSVREVTLRFRVGWKKRMSLSVEAVWAQLGFLGFSHGQAQFGHEGRNDSGLSF